MPENMEEQIKTLSLLEQRPRQLNKSSWLYSKYKHALWRKNVHYFILFWY